VTNCVNNVTDEIKQKKNTFYDAAKENIASNIMHDYYGIDHLTKHQISQLWKEKSNKNSFTTAHLTKIAFFEI